MTYLPASYQTAMCVCGGGQVEGVLPLGRSFLEPFPPGCISCLLLPAIAWTQLASLLGTAAADQQAAD